MTEKFNILFISGKLGDVDGVSLEVDKWIEILAESGHSVFTLSGTYATPVKNVLPEQQFLNEKLRFDSKEQRYFEKLVFPYLSQSPTHLTAGQKETVVENLWLQGEDLGSEIYRIIQDNTIDLIIAQNTNAMPMTLLGGIAVYKLATAYKVATIFHHHDFWWERSRFSQNRIESLLNRIMPPGDLGTEHVVISSYSAHILRSLKRVAPFVIPNCEDFNDVTIRDEYNSTFRGDLGFSEDDILFVQPTRIVPRKRIEDSISLIEGYSEVHPELKDRIKLVVSLYQGDEPDVHYIDRIKELARKKGVSLFLISDRVASVRGTDSEGKKLFTNRDVLVNADIVTYLPVWEGFGNAFLEAVACRVPIVVSTYLVYKTDIKNAGFKSIEIRDDYDSNGDLVIPLSVYDAVHEALFDTDTRSEMIETNFEIGKKEFGYTTLRNKLNEVLESYGDEIKASRRRLKKSKTNYAV